MFSSLFLSLFLLLGQSGDSSTNLPRASKTPREPWTEPLTEEERDIIYEQWEQSDKEEQEELKSHPGVMHLVFGDWGENGSLNWLHGPTFFLIFVVLFTPWFNGWSIMGLLNWIVMPLYANNILDNIDKKLK